MERNYSRAAVALLAPDAPLRFYLARRDGEAAAAVEVAAAAPALGVYSLSTRRAHRGLGIGTALLTRCLFDAAPEIGGSVAVMQAALAAVDLYRRIGFSQVGRITEFKPVRSV